ncbi:HNH endonuclease [Mycolicibacterium pyrenivorans]|uniref:HNH endonuclease n=1 Tax=Mycolicibacterium pyrenivorans TaxID=187102 RepID=UPI0035585A2A|nr:HNH endonuclease [Mycolicibacterium pyrenivorans]
MCQLRWRGCTGKATDVDHRRRGNDHSLQNLQSVCSTCHKQKTAKESAARKAALKARAKRPTQRHPGAIENAKT